MSLVFSGLKDSGPDSHRHKLSAAFYDERMTRTRHDQFAKEFLAGLLDPFGETATDVKVTSELRAIDLVFTPHPDSDPSSLGLLGQIARTPCLIEPYRNPPTAQDLRICLMRLAIFEGEQRRHAKRQKISVPKTGIPLVWVVAPTLSAKFLRHFGAIPTPNWPTGVYFLAPGLRAVLVAVHQLPARRDTLWLRVLGRGKVQQQAIREVLELPSSSPERTEVLRLLTNWQLGLKQSEAQLDKEEAEMAVQLNEAYLAWEKATLERGKLEGKLEGKQEGKLEGKQEGKLEVVPSLYSRGFNLQQIAEILDLPLEQVQSVMDQRPQ